MNTKPAAIAITLTVGLILIAGMMMPIFMSMADNITTVPEDNENAIYTYSAMPEFTIYHAPNTVSAIEINGEMVTVDKAGVLAFGENFALYSVYNSTYSGYLVSFWSTTSDIVDLGTAFTVTMSGDTWTYEGSETISGTCDVAYCYDSEGDYGQYSADSLKISNKNDAYAFIMYARGATHLGMTAISLDSESPLDVTYYAGSDNSASSGTVEFTVEEDGASYSLSGVKLNYGGSSANITTLIAPVSYNVDAENGVSSLIFAIPVIVLIALLFVAIRGFRAD